MGFSGPMADTQKNKYVRDPPDFKGDEPTEECQNIAADLAKWYVLTQKQLFEDLSAASGSEIKKWEEVAVSLANRKRDMAIVGLVGLGVGAGLSYVISDSLTLLFH